jgi:hypothetical protein
MQPVTVLVIEESAAEATLLRAALARCPEVRVVESPAGPLAPLALAIAGDAALAGSAHELVKKLGARGIPVIGIAADLSPAARRRALAAGVREIHDRPRAWRHYSELIESLVGRFTRTGSPPHRGPTS